MKGSSVNAKRRTDNVTTDNVTSDNATTDNGSRVVFRFVVLSPAVLCLLACGQKQEPQASAQPPTQSAAESDSQLVARLEREAKALAKTDGCTSADECRAAPLGERACGGPRDYLVYCARSTDSAALYRKLAELRQAEMTMNQKSNVMSTCEFRTPPELGISTGTCKPR